MQVAAIAVLARAEAAAVIYGACAVYGFSVGNNITLSPLIIQREYAAADFPAIVALSTAVVQIVYAFGPGLLGVLRDAFGGYGVPLAVCLGLNLAAAAVILMRPPIRRRASAQELEAVHHLVDHLARAMDADADEIERIGRCCGDGGAIVGVVGGLEHRLDVDRRPQRA